MNELFADTSYFLALVNPQDDAHERAMEFTRRRAARMITTAWVLMELGNALSNHRLKPAFLRTMQIVRADTSSLVLEPDQEQLDAGYDLYSRRSDKNWSLTDCISFNVMSERGITDALTADHHFEQAGFKALLK